MRMLSEQSHRAAAVSLEESLHPDTGPPAAVRPRTRAAQPLSGTGALPEHAGPNTMKQETTMKTIFAVFFVALMALTGATATAYAYDAAPDRTTVSGNAAG
jgi:hypothetical protein